jgi:uncharacterized protein YqjF (DUF2071 family)
MSDSRVCDARVVDHSSFRWVWSQQWVDVLFLHWRVSPSELKPHLPGRLEIDMHDGAAWVSLVLFRLRVRPRWLPFVPGFSNLLEANLRTYVRLEGQPGIWFLDVLADNAWAIRAAKLLTPMPYTFAELTFERRRRSLRYEIRRGDDLPQLSIACHPASAPPVFEDRLDDWLLERYRLYLRGRRGLVQAEVIHPPWEIQCVEFTHFSSRVGQALNLDLSRTPDCVHFSRGVKARFGRFTAAGLRH